MSGRERPPIACMELMFGDVGGERFEPWLDDVAAAGFEGVAVRSVYLQPYRSRASALLAVLRPRGLRLAAAYALIDTPADEFERWCEFLSEVQCRNLVLYGGARGDAQRAAATDLLNVRGEQAAKSGVALSYHHHTHNTFESFSETEELLRLTDPRFVRLFVDTGHAAKDFAGLPPATRALELIRRNWERVAYVEFKEWSPETDLSTELGRGSTDFTAIAAFLIQRKYPGWITLEQNSPTKGCSALECARRNLEFTRRVFESAAACASR